ncbi:MAG: dephospho-CoA kinase [Ruminiclostridium sp.]|nr:dephospho-CoA kinase [Ruminiclostridium sp.]
MLYAGDNIFIAGLTGMSGAGKTTACRVFAECGFRVIDCDITARRVVQAGKPALAAIAERFSADVLLPDGSLDRRKLGGAVFSDRDALDALNRIIYPFITFDIIREAADSGAGIILLDAPTLFESGADRLCDTIVCVTAEREFCAERIMKRDGLTREQAEARLSSQHDAGFYTSRSRYSAVNSGTLAEFESALRDIAGNVLRDAEGRI